MILRWAALCLLLGSAGCTGVTTAGYRSDIERTWYEAALFLPEGTDGAPTVGLMSTIDVKAALAERGSGRRWPVVLLLHGCTGFGDADFAKHLARAGYVVVAPDSMARRFRPLQCDPKNQTGGMNPFVYDFRTTELSFALHRLWAEPWVDTENLFLVGISEGAVAAGLYRAKAFNARVLMQWTCHGGALVRGIDAPRDTPVLSIVRADDPWYAAANTRNQAGDCGAFMGGRSNSESLVLGGQQHDVTDATEINDRVVEFFNRHRAP